jgi:ABC-2 type transport system ATP-binding protein
MLAIKTVNLTKKFDDLLAVNKINLKIKKGELFGFLGPNGAGKTTAINILSTLLDATSGRAEVAGFDVEKDKDNVRRSIGVVFQEPALDGQLTGWENLEFHAMLYGIDKPTRTKKILEVLELVELINKKDVLVDNYSGGMKRRLEIARGLIHRPKVLFLDEPTLGLDAQTRRHIWDYIKDLNKTSDVTIILTTHYMEEADYLCDRIAIIDFGKIVALDTPKNLKDVLGGDVISIQVNGNLKKLVKKLDGMDWIRTMKQHDGTLSLTVERGEVLIPKLINFATKKGIEIKSVNLRKPSLEDVFLHYTGKTIREREVSQKDRNRQMAQRHARMRR